MISHEQLVRELPVIQQMSAERRLLHALQRRSDQLKYWQLQEKSNEQYPDKRLKGKHKSKDLKFMSEVMLLDATQRNDIEEVKRLLSSGIRPDIKNHDGFTAVHQSSIDGNNEMLKLLISYGADVNCTDDDGWTPLHAAAACRRRSIIRTLLENGADILAMNSELTFPNDMTDDYEISNIFNQELAKRGIKEYTLDEYRNIPETRYLQFLKKGGRGDSAVILQRIDSTNATHLHFAAAYNFSSAAKYLIQLGITVDSLDNRLWTPLHIACYFSQRSMVQLLLENSANPRLATDNGQNAFDLCSDDEFRIWLTNFVAILHQCDILQRRSTLPAQYNISSNDWSMKRNSIRRTSLRESKHLRRHDDNYGLVLAAKDHMNQDHIDASNEDIEVDFINMNITNNSDATGQFAQMNDYPPINGTNVIEGSDQGNSKNGSQMPMGDSRPASSHISSQHQSNSSFNVTSEKQSKRKWFHCCTLL